MFNPVPKIKPGQLSLAEERALKKARREQGVIAKTRAAKHTAVERGERVNKDIVRERDQACRWPFCDCREKNDPIWSQLEVAHVRAKGAGGDPELERSQPENLILLCKWTHQGPFGLHAGRAKVEPLTEHGTRDCGIEAEDVKQRGSGREWFAGEGKISRVTSSKSTARKAASAHIAKIPFVLARHIARAWHP